MRYVSEDFLTLDCRIEFVYTVIRRRQTDKRAVSPENRCLQSIRILEVNHNGLSRLGLVLSPSSRFDHLVIAYHRFSLSLNYRKFLEEYIE